MPDFLVYDETPEGLEAFIDEFIEKALDRDSVKEAILVGIQAVKKALANPGDEFKQYYEPEEQLDICFNAAFDHLKKLATEG